MTRGIDPMTSEQQQQLETEIAVIESALEHLSASQVAEVDPIYRVFLSMAESQIRLGLGGVQAVCKMQARLRGEAS